MKAKFHNGRIGIKIGNQERIFNWYQFKMNLNDWYQKTFWKPIYFIEWYRDCDMCEGEFARVIYGRKRFEEYKEDRAEGADGPMSWNEISKEEYEDYVAPPVRDRIFEAFEDGRGTSIYV